MSNNELPDCEACTKGTGEHKYNTKQHGAMPQSWIDAQEKKRPRTSSEIAEKIRSLKEKYKGRWVQINPYSDLGKQSQGLPLFDKDDDGKH